MGSLRWIGGLAGAFLACAAPTLAYAQDELERAVRALAWEACMLPAPPGSQAAS